MTAAAFVILPHRCRCHHWWCCHAAAAPRHRRHPACCCWRHASTAAAKLAATARRRRRAAATLGRARSEQQKRISCERSCVNDQCRITVHYGTIYILDRFWWWMKAIAKVVLPPPSVIRNGAMEQVYRSGEDNFNDGHHQFLAWKKFEQFFSIKGSRHFPRVRFLSDQSYLCT